MLNEAEREELKLYKARLWASTGLYIFYLCVSLIIILFFKENVRLVIGQIILANLIVVVIFDVFLYSKDEYAYSKLLGLFILCYIFTWIFSIVSFYMINDELIKWDMLFNIILLFIVLFSFISVFIYGLSYTDFIDEAVKKNKLDIESSIYKFFTKGTIKSSKNLANKVGLLVVLIPGVGVVTFFLLGYRGDLVNLKHFIQVVGVFMGAVLCSGYSAIYLARAIQLRKYEKKTGRPVYTGLIKYIRREDEINAWRKERNLKPIRIKSPFFFGDIEK